MSNKEVVLMAKLWVYKGGQHRKTYSLLMPDAGSFAFIEPGDFPIPVIISEMETWDREDKVEISMLFIVEEDDAPQDEFAKWIEKISKRWKE